jgi:glycosyltransferase involved in cell wall biosynthesis
VNDIGSNASGVGGGAPLRALLVIDHLGTGGAQRQLVNLGVQLHRFGHEIEFFTYYPARDLRAPVDAANLRVWETRKASRFSIRVPWALRQRLRAGEYDIALSYLDTPNFYLELAAAGLQKTAVVVSQRAQYLPGKLSVVKRALETFHKLADHVVVNSHSQMQRMVDEFPWLADRISTINNGVQEAFFGVTRPAHPRQGLRLLVVATVVPLKNAHGLIEALDLCRRESRTAIRVAWAGRRADEHYFNTLERRIDELGLRGHWEWLGQRSDIPGLMSECDALVHPSHSEGFPNAICEALAAGMPIAAGNVGDHPMLVSGARAGYLFDPGQPPDIAAALLRLARLSQSELRQLGDNARQFAVEQLSMHLCARRYEALFARLASGEVASCAV